MKLEIWSDINCPFCYIAKKNFEKALHRFEHKSEIEIEWRSYQLYPEIKTNQDSTYFSYLAERDEITVEDIAMEYEFIQEMADDADIKMNLANARVINTRNAHRLLQFAKINGKSSEAEELLFKSYFDLNLNIDKPDILLELVEELNLNKDEFKLAFDSKSIEQLILDDLKRAKTLGINSVPHFKFNENFSIQGSQDESAFIKALEKAWNTAAEDNTDDDLFEKGLNCSIDGSCN